MSHHTMIKQPWASRSLARYCSSAHRARTLTLVKVAKADERQQIQQELLETWWQARGVHDEQQRQRLVSFALSSLDSSDLMLSAVPLGPDRPLPGVPSTWMSTSGDTATDVLEVSRRLLQLQQYLGTVDTDDAPTLSSGELVFMVLRQPDLLTSDTSQVIRRLLEMRVATAGSGVDVIKMVAEQPALLSASSTWQNSTQESMGELMRAWESGLATGSDWNDKFQQLSQYASEHGDTCVGFRDGDDAELARWTTKQRKDFRSHLMPQSRIDTLISISFIFDEDEAEWVRWYSELVKFVQVQGHCYPGPLSQGVDLRLVNWVSIQRIARRSKVLSDSRVSRLDDLDFDWAGADPLS